MIATEISSKQKIINMMLEYQEAQKTGSGYRGYHHLRKTGKLVKTLGVHPLNPLKAPLQLSEVITKEATRHQGAIPLGFDFMDIVGNNDELTDWFWSGVDIESRRNKEWHSYCEDTKMVVTKTLEDGTTVRLASGATTRNGHISSVYTELMFTGLGLCQVVMKALHVVARLNGNEYTTLSASDLGSRIYEHMGYEYKKNDSRSMYYKL